jgi:hypothetical protein
MNLAQALGISAAARPPFGVTAVWMLILVLIVSFLGATVVFRAIATQLRAPPPMALGDAIDRALARGRMWVWGISGVSLAIAPTPLALWLASAASLGLCAVSTLYVIPFLLPKLAHKSPALSGAKAPG